MNKKALALLTLIIFIGAFFRFFDLNWDQGFHLHPDERFLTMVGVASKLPNNFLIYLDPTISPLNPANNNFSFFVYGIFPITLVKILAVFFHMDTYDSFTILGRFVSALTDTGIILLVFLTAKILTEKYNLHKNIPLASALFYAIAVLPIQLAHFFTVDTFLNFFMFLSFYAVLLYEKTKKNVWLLLSAISFGIALACKITAVYALPLLFVILISAIFIQEKKKMLLILEIVFSILLYSLVTYFIVRLADPYMFASINLFNPTLSHSFIQSLQSLTAYDGPSSFYPPGIQWDSKPILLFTLEGIALYGFGFIPFLLALFGFFKITKHKRWILISMIAWVVLFFIWQSSQFSRPIRYFLFVFPFLSIFGGIGYVSLVKQRKLFIRLCISLLIFIWPLCFFSIYLSTNTRVEASKWIYNTIPSNKTLLTEYWDDALPLPLNYLNKSYNIEFLHVFDPDTNGKWTIMNKQLQEADYYILSSNRAWASIMPLSQKYPRMSEFYKKLLSNKTGYKEIKQFTSYPSLTYLGIPLILPDDYFEESFTVYDHPKVMIFKNTTKK